MPKAISFFKLRAAYAEVGSDTSPYKNGQPMYSSGGTYNGYPVLTESSTITNPSLKPENTTSYELGTDLRFLKNAITLDGAVYKNITTNQILSVPADIASGYTTRSINLGKVQNKGVEAVLGITPISNQNFKWTTSFNFATNKSKVSDLGGIDYTIGDGNKVYLQAREGKSISAMYGVGFKRVEDKDSPYYGKIIYDSSGAPIRTDDLEYQGDYAPDFTLGIQSQFKIKNFDFSFLLDTRQGGIVSSRTKIVGSLAGQLKETLVGREEGIIGDGVIQVSEGVYQPNETRVTARTYYKSYYKGNNIEASKYDASYTKLREVSLGYTIPKKISEKLFIDSVRLSITGRNLALWTENPHFDPETLSVYEGSIKPGVEYMSLPSTRSFSFNVNINF